MTDSVRILLDAFAAGTGVPDHVLAPDAVVDATVPDWRFSIRGAAAIRRQFAEWFADPGVYEELDRTPIDGGELVTFVLSWTEHGVPHACHQSHILRLDAEGRIAHDTLFCGGRWDAGLLAAMEEADRVSA